MQEVEKFDPLQNLKTYSLQLEEAILRKFSQIDEQRSKFYEILRKFSIEADIKQVDYRQVEGYLDGLNILKEDFDEPLGRKRNKNNIIRIPKQEIDKIQQEQKDQQQQQQQSLMIPVSSDYEPRKKRKYIKRAKPAEGQPQKDPPKRKRRTKKEMEEARMLKERQTQHGQQLQQQSIQQLQQTSSQNQNSQTSQSQPLGAQGHQAQQILMSQSPFQVLAKVQPYEPQSNFQLMESQHSQGQQSNQEYQQNGQLSSSSQQDDQS